MSKQRRTADDFVRDMKAKQQHTTSGVRRGSVEQQDACATTTASNSLTFISKVSLAGGSAAKLLTKDEARRIAVNVAKLPEFLRKP